MLTALLGLGIVIVLTLIVATCTYVCVRQHEINDDDTTQIIKNIG